MDRFENKARWVSKNNNPEFNSGSRILTTPEQIVREFRVGSRGLRIESVKKPVSKVERAIRIFFWIILGWAAGYLHHYLAGG